MNFVSVDGGGTKLNAIWFDEHMNMLGRAKSRGVNGTISPRHDYLNQIRECFQALFGENRPERIDCLYVVCGSSANYLECLEPAVKVQSKCELGETHGGLLAGLGVEKGIVIMAGTGSDALYYGPDGADAVGGVGAILGDQGSGVWMARQAVQNAIRYSQNWGEETVLTELLKTRLGIETGFPGSLVHYIYASPAPFQKLGELLPLVAEAAKAGDKPCISAFVRGGEMLAEQTIALIRKHPDFGNRIVTCGGAWKAYRPMFDTYKARLHQEYPEIEVCLPWFEHVIAGPMKYLLDNGSTLEAAKETLLRAFPAYEWRMNP